ncbi:Fc.00g115320.m01.CDS01 [Cosmosporella sp. VM-42]
MATRSVWGPARPCRQVPEASRERETFKYHSSLHDVVRFQDSARSIPSSELSTSEDAVLTALAQLGACQTGTDRSLVSLFDSSHQYIIGEATPGSPLNPSLPSNDCSEPLCLCGTAIPRGHGVCEYSLLEIVPEASDTTKDHARDAEPRDFGSGDLPLTLSQDLVEDSRFSSKPYVRSGSLGRFYAAVPIRTRRGINIGVYCVANTTPCKEWTDQHTEYLRAVSRTIMTHLESQRAADIQRRNERMNRGLGSFIEGKATMSGWRGESNVSAFQDKPGYEGALNARQQTLQRDEDEAAANLVDGNLFPSQLNATISNNSTPPIVDGIIGPSASATTTSLCLPDISTFEPLGLAPEAHSPASVFSKVANIIREAIEVEGCLFFDATMGSYRTPISEGKSKNGFFSQSSSSDESPNSSNEEQRWQSCEVLGFSTTETASIDGVGSKLPFATMGEKVLTQLLRRYPKGKIFNFDANGELQTSDSSEDDGQSTSLKSDKSDQQGRAESPASRSKRLKKPWLRQYEGSMLQEAFPGARSVIFIPVWDPRKDRWYAGGFIYTKTPFRVFTLEGELSYLRAFGMLAAAEIVRFNTLLADKAKSDALGSLSHELRSPLHGVLLSAELLIDTDLDAFQGNAAHTIETCARTLLDTIDHLLDYSKINKFAGRSASSHQALRVHGPELDRAQFGRKKLFLNARLDGLVEEVVESVFAGFNFQHLSLKQLQNDSARSDVRANRHTDSLHAMEQLGPNLSRDGELHLGFGDLKIFLSIDSRCNWLYDIQVGAIRRIVMNLFGNALKYTQHGHIRVSLTQELVSIKRRKKRKVVKLVVQDTGKGIGADYLENGLYKPFSQEDDLAPGTGLGLSLVKQITSQLRGQISLESQVGVGTTFTVTLPLEQVTPSPETDLLLSEDDKAFTEHVQDLRGLRVRIHGSEKLQDGPAPTVQGMLEDICRDWLQMEVIPDTANDTLTPDLVLWLQDALPSDQAELESHTKTPNVVMCSNALVAHRQSTSFNTTSQAGIFEFISQPAGPRKLAKTLLLAFRRWMGVPRFPPSEDTMPMMPPKINNSNPLLSMEAAPSARQPILRRTSATSSLGVATPTEHSTSTAWPSSTDKSTVGSATSNGDFQKTIDAIPPSQFLLVDDNCINLKILSSYMKRLGLEYNTAANGQEAVDAYVKNPRGYTCILMDISMPIMNGFEATRCIRAYETKHRLKFTPIIALSGLASEDAQQEAFGSGMDLFLTKPVRLQVLGTMLRERGMMA